MYEASPFSGRISNKSLDDPEKYDGAPAAVQILGRRFDEEKLLSIAQLVVDALNAHPECLADV